MVGMHKGVYVHRKDTGIGLDKSRETVFSDTILAATVPAGKSNQTQDSTTAEGRASKEIDKLFCPLNIYTFSRFTLVLNGSTVEFAGKVQHKPLAMLKVLIALGGRNIRAPRIIELLWPDTEITDSHQSFKITLHRLRRLLGIEQAIQFQEGCLNLDQRLCWVDVWAFERLVGRVDALRSAYSCDADPEEIVSLTDLALSLYSGHFLIADKGQPWALSTRERLHSKFVRLITNAGYAWEKAGVWHKAAECYQRGLETDDRVEEFYQRLLVCYRQLGKRGEAQLLYDRCRATFALLGIKPSAITRSVYQSVISD